MEPVEVSQSRTEQQGQARTQLSSEPHNLSHHPNTIQSIPTASTQPPTIESHSMLPGLPPPQAPQTTVLERKLKVWYTNADGITNKWEEWHERVRGITRHHSDHRNQAYRGQWNSPKTQSKTGGAGWTPVVPTSSTGGFRSPMPGQPMTAAGAQPPAAQWSGGMQMGAAFSQQPMQGMGMSSGVMAGGFPAAGAQPTVQPAQAAQPAGFDPFGAL
nr:uncharacterized protein LOC128699819 [Cherax quadricarinatus]